MPTKVSGRENKMCEKRQRVVPKLEKMTVVEEEDVRHSLQHIKGHCKKYGVCFFFFISVLGKGNVMNCSKRNLRLQMH